MATTLRPEVPVRYRTTIIRQIILALRDVFNSVYPQTEFASLNIVPEYPLSEIDYPAIVVNYNGGRITNAGVGHREYFADPQGNVREWGHRRFEGEFEFTAVALSPLERDVLVDALVEVLSFSDLTQQPVLSAFHYRIYGNPNGEPPPALFQIAVNTDIIDEGGNTVGMAPWQPEDVLLYETTLRMQVVGGFYNAIPNTPAYPYLEKVNLMVYDTFDLDGANMPHTDDGAPWSHLIDYYDNNVVKGKGKIIPVAIPKIVYLVVGTAKISGINRRVLTDLATVIGQAVVFGQATYSDAATAVGSGVITWRDFITMADSAVVTGVAAMTTTEPQGIFDSGTVTGLTIIAATDRLIGANAGTATGTGAMNSVDTMVANDIAAPVVGLSAIGSVENEAVIDTFTVVGSMVAAAAEEYANWMIISAGVAATVFESLITTDSFKVVGTANIEGLDGFNAALIANLYPHPIPVDFSNFVNSPGGGGGAPDLSTTKTLPKLIPFKLLNP